MRDRTHNSFVQVLRERASELPDRQAFGAWGEAQVDAWMTYGELDRRARAIAAELQRTIAPGDRVLLLYLPGFDYIAAFFGCLYAHAIAVPVYPPQPGRLDRTLPRLTAILSDAGSNVVLTSQLLLSMTQPVASRVPELARLRWIATDRCNDADAWREPVLSPDSMAFLQYTSGSTSAPKGVKLTHGNLLHNAEVIRGAHEYHPDTRMVAWVPPYHDMGLIGSILEPVFAGFPCVLMSPTAFLMRPLRWLQAITAVRATTSGGPNFAFELCTRKITAEQRKQLDLSSWEVAYCGAEPIRRDTLENFAQTFAGCGFRKTALYPCYGLAESTLMVTGVRKAEGAIALPRRISAVSVGTDVTGGELLIVNPETHEPCNAVEVGEIWIQSPSVAQGYWNRPEESADTFGATLADGRGPFLRTGDLGFLRGGHLYVTGRRKEVMIIHGRKHFPNDLEVTVEQALASGSHYRAGGSAVFSHTIDGEERVFAVVEIERRRRERRSAAAPAPERRRGSDRRHRPYLYKPTAAEETLAPAELVLALRQAVAGEHGVEVYAVIAVRPGSIPKTSSGKKQRLLCKQHFLTGARSEDVLFEWWSRGAEGAQLRKVG